MADFNKVGLLAINDDRLLLCRKDHFTSKLILPGGRIEAGESSEECLSREILEELGEVTLLEMEYVGTYQDRAASDDPSIEKTVEIQLFRGDIIGNPVASSEIVELVWFGQASDRSELSPILINKILPDLIDRGLLNWER
jgi:8-oxo-dGTP pyrophosphatase MutT (NUDIX family)